MKRTLLVVVAGATAVAAIPAQLPSATASGPAIASASAPTASTYRNCKALNRVYPHGVGRYGARDHTSGTPVTNFRRSNRLYRLNKGLDRDKDGGARRWHLDLRAGAADGTSAAMIDLTYGHLTTDSEESLRARLDARATRAGDELATEAEHGD